MKRMIIIVEKNKLIFSYEDSIINKETMLKKLIYDIPYLIDNIDVTIVTLKEILKNINITEVIIDNYELINITLKIIKYIYKIEKLTIKENILLDYNICKQIILIDHIKYLECYNVVETMLDEFKEKNTNVFLRKEKLGISNFISVNNLNTYNDIYTKDLVVFKNQITKKDLEDFDKFCKTNEYISTINILGNFKLDDLKFIIDSLINNNLNNVLINIYPESIDLNNNENLFNNIKKLNKKIKKSNGIIIKTNFSNNYKINNFIKQLNFNNFKIIVILVIVIVSIELIYISHNLYITNKDIEDAQSLNPQNVVISEENIIIEEEEPIQVPNTEEAPDNTQTENNSQTAPTPALIQDFSKLVSINPDTVGWLTVNNTKIDYPVVQTINNKYYLNKNFYKRNSIAGWIYMDYRNKIDVLDQNTIIYGHSGMKNLSMFSSLNKIMKESWLKNTSNHIITFNTLNANMKWQIFSIYVTEPTFDYLRNNYYDDGTRFTNFLNDVKSRSIYNFNVDVNNKDNILTLSTCYEQGTKRLVVHAKLLK